MEKRLKELKKSPERVKRKILQHLVDIQTGNFQGLDIRPIINKPGMFRRRVGEYRVLLIRNGKEFEVSAF